MSSKVKLEILSQNETWEEIWIGTMKEFIDANTLSNEDIYALTREEALNLLEGGTTLLGGGASPTYKLTFLEG